jgi:hypothetical protein
VKTRGAFKYAAVGTAAGLAIALGATGSAVADHLINSGDIQNNSVKAADLAPNSVHGSELANFAVQWSELTPGLRDRLAHMIGANGANGTNGAQGPAGPKGDKGDKGDPASDSAGKLVGHVVATDKVIKQLGGSFKTGKTLVGSMSLPAGTYLISGSGFFDRVNDSIGPSGSRLQLAVRDGDSTTAFGNDDGTCVTGAFRAPDAAAPSNADREASCALSRVLTLGTTTTLNVYLFGYNDDGSDDGGDNFNADVDVAAMRVS